MSEWISVEERLPQYSGLYNVVCEVASVGGGYTDVRSYRYSIVNGNLGRTEGWMIPDVFDEVVCVTHWMPLPEAPK